MRLKEKGNKENNVWYAGLFVTSFNFYQYEIYISPESLCYLEVQDFFFIFHLIIIASTKTHVGANVARDEWIHWLCDSVARCSLVHGSEMPPSDSDRTTPLTLLPPFPDSANEDTGTSRTGLHGNSR